MDSFNNSVTNSPIHGNDENELSQEMALKLKIAAKKRLPTKHFMSPTISAASKASVPKKKILADSNDLNETPDVKEQPRLSRSLSFDSKASKLPVVDADNDVVDSSYHPVHNCFSPRPRFLRYNPDRLRKISLRQESVTRVRRSASFDSGMPASGEELESNEDHSLGLEEPVEKVAEVVDKPVGKDEDEDENEEFDEFEEDEDGGFCSNVFLKYFLVMIAVILTTLTISSVNSSTVSPVREALRGFMDQYTKTQSSVYRNIVGLNSSKFGGKAFDSTVQTDLIVGNVNKREIDYGYEWDKKGLVETTDESVDFHHGKIEEEEEEDKKGLVETTEELVNLHHGNIEEEEYDHLVGLETAEENNEIKEVEIDEVENQEECSYESQEAVIPVHESIESDKTEAEKEIHYRNDVTEEYEIVKKKFKSASFDPIFTASLGVVTLILMSLSVIYCSKKRKASSPIKTVISHRISKEIKNLEPVTNCSSFVPETQEEQSTNPESAMLNVTEIEVSNQTKAPTVELLSEFVIGREEVTSNMLVEEEPSSFFRFQGKNNESLIETDVMSSSRARSSHLKLSNVDSSSYGSIATEKNIVKKQRNKKVEVTPSPVRRSSRLQNRSVMSP